MESISCVIRPLIEKVEKLGRTTLIIYRYKLMIKISILLASILVGLLVSFCVLLATISLNIALANLLGLILKSTFLGYLIVSFIYILMGFLIYIFRLSILSKLQNYILVKLQSD